MLELLKTAWRDTRGRTSSSGDNLSNLDGLRGFAVLVVLMDHANAFNGVNRGGIGVIVFFVLSGFLLAWPVLDPARAVVVDGPFVRRFLVRRVRRVWPMYFLAITVAFTLWREVMRPFDVFATSGDWWASYLGHLVFLKSTGHFWSVAQEMYFYLLLPAVLWVIGRWGRRNLLFALAFLVPLMVVTPGLLQRSSWAYLHWNERRMDLLLEMFLAGVATAAAAHLVRPFSKPRPRLFGALVALPVAAAVFFLGFANPAYVQAAFGWAPAAWQQAMLVQSNPVWTAVSALLVLALALTSRGPANAVFSALPLRAIGVVGYSMYLVHPMVLGALRPLTSVAAWPGELLFAVGLLASYLVSAVTYGLVEMPFYKGQWSRPRPPAIAFAPRTE